jgi:hypothetical protein
VGHPGEDLPHHPGPLGVDLVAGSTATVVLADVAVAVGGTAEYADPADACRVLLATPTPFTDLCPFILGYDALDLQQQILRRAAARLTVEEHHLDPAALELVEEDGLVGEIPGQAVRCVDVETVQPAGGRQIAEPLQGRS